MNYFDSINICLRKFFVFKGRASRSEFWYFAITYFFLVIILTFLLEEGSTEESFTFAKLFPMLFLQFHFMLWVLDDYMMLTRVVCGSSTNYNFSLHIRGMELEFTIFGLIAEIVLLIFLALPGYKEDNKYGKKI